MISIEKATKKFENFTALSEISCEIQEAGVFGLVGSNGAGKSTLVRLIAGVYRPDGGTVKLDGEDIYENFAAKSRIAYVSDELYFLPGANLARMSKMYETVRPGFDSDKLLEYAKMLDLSMKNPISQFSKGMKRQAATILALASKPDVMLFDETFDGLDPVMRSVVKRLVSEDVMDRGAAAVITSHSLRELEDFCDKFILIDSNVIKQQGDIAEHVGRLCKFELAFTERVSEELFSHLPVVSLTVKNRFVQIVLEGDGDDMREKLEALSPAVMDEMPLDFEETFIHDVRKGMTV